ncbi:MAG: hypothetical protein FJ109_07355 [Deltaproteobacteria bacterium]|nr:hypothetical protein [Deltaproteobacteria bacterium]
MVRQQPGEERSVRLRGSLAGLLLPILLFFVASAALRFCLLGNKPYWIAEIQEFTYAWRDDALGFLPFAAGDILGFVYQRCCAVLGLPQVPAVVRGLSALTGSLLAPWLFLLLARRGLWKEGWFTALLATVSFPLLAASQEARYYIGLSTFLGLGLVIDLFAEASAKPVPSAAAADRAEGVSGSAEGPCSFPGRLPGYLTALGLLDALALLCHPYAAFWIGLRWCIRRPTAARLQSLRRCMGYAVPVLLAVSFQAVQLAAAFGRFRMLHDWFLLEEYPPGFQLLPELLAWLSGGTGWPLFLLAGLAGLGVFLLSSERPEAALRLLAVAVGGPFLVTLAIWLARGRFSFTHLLPAAVPVYLAAALGLSGLARLAARAWNSRPRAGRQATFVIPAAALALLLAFQPLVASLRFLYRPTRLELGADVRHACEELGILARLHSGPGNIVVTRYDKYFTAFAYYCGATLPPGTVVATPEAPTDPFSLAFNHLFPFGTLEVPGATPAGDRDGGQGLQPAGNGGTRATDTAVLLDDALARASPGTALFLLVPYFEDVEGEFNEAHGWLDLNRSYGAEVGPGYRAALFAHWIFHVPLVRVFAWKVGPPETRHRLRATLQTIFDGERPLR